MGPDPRPTARPGPCEPKYPLTRECNLSAIPGSAGKRRRRRSAAASTQEGRLAAPTSVHSAARPTLSNAHPIQIASPTSAATRMVPGIGDPLPKPVSNRNSVLILGHGSDASNDIGQLFSGLAEADDRARLSGHSTAPGHNLRIFEISDPNLLLVKEK